MLEKTLPIIGDKPMIGSLCFILGSSSRSFLARGRAHRTGIHLFRHRLQNMALQPYSGGTDRFAAGFFSKKRGFA